MLEWRNKQLIIIPLINACACVRVRACVRSTALVVFVLFALRVLLYATVLNELELN